MSSFHDKIPAWPMVGDEERELVLDVVNSGNWWRFAGNKVSEFERSFAAKHQTKYALAVSSGTNAIELALKALQVKPGDEVIVPAFTFISTAIPVMMLGAVPVPVDIDPSTFCMDPKSIREAITSRTVGMIPVHMAGHMCDMDEIGAIAKEHNLFIVEDACHAHGSEWKGRRAGSFGIAGTFSFQAFKLMTAGEGGLLTINSNEYYEDAFLFHHVGRPLGDKSYQHLVLGSNYRFSEFQGAVLLPQLERLDEQNQTRAKHAKLLNQELKRVKGIIPQGRQEACNIHSYYMYMFYYDPAAFGGLSRQEFVNKLNEAGIPAYISYSVIHETKVFKEFIQEHEELYQSFNLSCPVSYSVANDVVWIHHRALLAEEATVKQIAQFIEELQFVTTTGER